MVGEAHPRPGAQASDDDEYDEEADAGGDGPIERREEGTHGFLPLCVMG